MSEVRITVNGKPRSVSTGLSIVSLLQEMGVDLGHVAVERNEEVVPRKTWPEAMIGDGDRIEVVAFMGGGSGGAAADALVIGGRAFRSRLLIGTGKYRSIEETRKAIEASGAEIVTVALRRVDLAPGAATVLDAIDRKTHTLLPNTAGCYTAEEAMRTWPRHCHFNSRSIRGRIGGAGWGRLRGFRSGVRHALKARPRTAQRPPGIATSVFLLNPGYCARWNRQ